MSARLANVFFHNWIKKPGTVWVIDPTSGVLEEFEKLGCHAVVPGGPSNGLVDAGTWLTATEESLLNFAERPRADFRDLFKSGGILFVRVPASKDLLDKVLARLADHEEATFTIAQTYEVDGFRDFLFRAIDKKPTICVGMIAKNEERDLPKCLKSLEGVANGIVLLDTGSVDQTIKVAMDWCAEQMAENAYFFTSYIVEQYTDASRKDDTGDWKLWDFGKARNQYVERIEKDFPHFDYILWMDADDRLLDKRVRTFVYLDEYAMHGLQIESSGLKWFHHRLWKTKQGTRYKGRCHEYPGWTGKSCDHQDVTYLFHDGAPGLGENSNDRNLRILKEEMAEDPSSRTAFYLANTYKDRGLHKEAAEVYQKRMDFGRGYEDEYWFAVLYRGRCLRLSGQHDAARKHLLWAVSELPTWAEFWMELCFVEDAAKRYKKALGYALMAQDLPIVPTQLFRERDKYTDQPYRMSSWMYANLEVWTMALEEALIAHEKIGGPDVSWENRIRELAEKVASLETTSVREILEQEEKKPLVTKQNRVVFNRPGALGDVLMTLQLIEPFRELNPGVEIIYRTHPSTSKHLEIMMLRAGVDRIVSSEEPCPPREREINLVGYPVAKEGYPNNPMKRHLLDYFGDEMGIQNGKQKANLALVQPGYPELKEFEGKKPKYVTLHVKAGWSIYKEWPVERWAEVVKKITADPNLNLKVVQIGGPDDPKIPGANHEALGQSWGFNLACQAHASYHLGIDSWTNHSTNIDWVEKGKTPSVILWGSTQASAAGYDHNVNISLGLACQPCFKENPWISTASRGPCENPPGQTYEKPQHSCMQWITPQEVLEAFYHVIRNQFFSSKK